MFTIQQMQAAHAKIRTGADFPAYVQEIKELGLIRYEYLVSNGTTVYLGADHFQVRSEPIYPEKTISEVPYPAIVTQIINDHQEGKTDFLTFCTQVANAGVEKWILDTQEMLCSYYDIAGNVMVAEPVPGRGY